MLDSMVPLIIISLAFGLASWLIFMWAVKSGQFDDIEGPKHRMMDDDDDEVRRKQPPAPLPPSPAGGEGEEKLQTGK